MNEKSHLMRIRNRMISCEESGYTNSLVLPQFHINRVLLRYYDIFHRRVLSRGNGGRGKKKVFTRRRNEFQVRVYGVTSSTPLCGVWPREKLMDHDGGVETLFITPLKKKEKRKKKMFWSLHGHWYACSPIQGRKVDR